MRRTDVTYGQLDRVLRSLGFSRHLVKKQPPALHYVHKESGAFITMPPYPETDRVLDYHLLGARTAVDGFGILDAAAFGAEIRKAGRRRRATSGIHLPLSNRKSAASERGSWPVCAD